MAEGLFTPTGFTSPEEIRRRIGKTTADEATAFGIQQANMFRDPGQRILAQIGGAFGRGLAGGYLSRPSVQDQISQQESMKSALSGVNLSDRASMYSAAQSALNSGNIPLATTLMKMAPTTSERRIEKGADGYNYYLDTGERVFPNVKKTTKDNRGLTGSLVNVLSEMRKPDGMPVTTENATPEEIKTANATLRDYQLKLKKAGVQSPSLLEDLSKLQTMPLYRNEINTISTIDDRVSSLDKLVNKPDLNANDIQLMRQNLSQLAATSIKAASEVAAFKNRGTLAQRLAGGIKSFLTGVPLESQLQDIKNTIQTYKDELLKPAKQEMKSNFTSLLKEGGHSEKSINIGVNALFGSKPDKKIVRTGTDETGRKVNMYSDGSIEYAD